MENAWLGNPDLRMTEQTPIRIILVDDHDLVRAGMHAMLDRLPNVKVVGEARNGEETLELIARENPDLAFVDVSMPGVDGLTLIRSASVIAPKVRFIILSMYPSEGYVSEALRSGASGYLLKQNADLAELELAIQCVMLGRQYLTPPINRQVVKGFIRPGESDGPRPLTPRQRDILRLIGEGYGTKEIATRLNISVKTVETHRADLMDRLGIYDVAGLVRHAIRTGLVTITTD
jgi:DNA-binding NarL/FixJ family response regulator